MTAPINRERAWYWDLLQLIAAVGGIGYGLSHTPATVAGIPFVRVVPALLLGGVAAGAVDLVRAFVAPEPHDLLFWSVAIALLAAGAHVVKLRLRQLITGVRIRCLEW